MKIRYVEGPYKAKESKTGTIVITAFAVLTLCMIAFFIYINRVL